MRETNLLCNDKLNRPSTIPDSFSLPTPAQIMDGEVIVCKEKAFRLPGGIPVDEAVKRIQDAMEQYTPVSRPI